MSIDPASVGASAGPKLVTWTDRDTLLYALGVGAGPDELALVTENSHELDQQVLPTFAVIVAAPFAVLPKVGKPSYATMLHGGQEVRIVRPLQPAGKLLVTAEVTELQDKGAGNNAIVVLTGSGTDPDSGDLVTQTVTTLVFRGQGGFGGDAGVSPVRVQIPDGPADEEVVDDTDERLPLIYRLSGDRNPLHSDPWFAREKAGFPKPIMHGLCTYGVVGRGLVRTLCGGDPTRLTALAVRFSAPVFPGDRLVTSVWRREKGEAVFRTEAQTPGAPQRRVVLDGGRAQIGNDPH